MARLIYIFIFIPFFGLSQKSIIIQQSHIHKLWKKVIVHSEDTLITYPIKEITRIDNLKNKALLEFKADNNLKYDTIIDFNIFRKKYYVNLTEINERIKTSNNLTNLFLKSDSSLIYFEIVYMKSGCATEPVSEQIRIIKYHGDFKAVYINKDYADIIKSENWYHTKTINTKEIEKLATYEQMGKQNDCFCFNGFVGENCLINYVIFDGKLSYFTNNYDLFEERKLLKEFRKIMTE